jgi:hypothetical protein
MSENIKPDLCEFCRSSNHTTERHKTAMQSWADGIDNPEEVDKAEKRGPATLDIIKIDGRWAQVKSVQINSEDETTLGWLDDKTYERINLSKYRLKKYFQSHVNTFRELNLISDKEFDNVHWASGDPDYLKNFVTVFGEYERK